jgi:hypothetical protein
MSQLFSLDAQRCGAEQHASAQTDGLGIALDLDGRLVRV